MTVTVTVTRTCSEKAGRSGERPLFTEGAIELGGLAASARHVVVGRAAAAHVAGLATFLAAAHVAGLAFLAASTFLTALAAFLFLFGHSLSPFEAPFRAFAHPSNTARWGSSKPG